MLQLLVTGQHLDRSRGRTVDSISRAGFTVDATVPWMAGSSMPAGATGLAMAGIATAFERLKPDRVVVVGDRVEAFAAASAAHLLGLRVVHIHGGEIAQGQADDSLRHAITKLSHVHCVATVEAAKRIRRLGERPESIHVVGAPGIERISLDAMSRRTLLAGGIVSRGPMVLVLLHPTSPDPRLEADRARLLIKAVCEAFNGQVMALYPNVDPGSTGIVKALEQEMVDGRITLLRHADRSIFLGLLREAKALVGNSSAGIIEAGCLGTPVVDVGDRQSGRTRGENVAHADFESRDIVKVLRQQLERGRYRKHSPYARPGTAARIVSILRSRAVDGLPIHKTFCD
jgi:UDP-hydrolysing UDP-N-acetyl-D-glucosamine 2-epimerase